MKLWSKDIIRGAIIGFLLPAVLFHIVAAVLAQTEEPPLPSGTQITLPPPVTQTTSADLPLFMPVQMNGEVIQMDIEKYLIGVLLAEMPADFEMEALKAQAVAARTYALKCHAQGYKHTGAVCTNASCCQGYMTQEAYLEAGGSRQEILRVITAVSHTAGEVLCYDGKLILATYFDCSGGSTEDAAAVWGQVYPYLQAVPSPGEEKAAYFEDEITVTPEQLQEALGCILPEDPKCWFDEFTYTPGGGVDTVKIGGVSYRGTTLRSLLGLRSTAFEIKVDGENIVFLTRGYGHRVGLSQYGADAMAIAGSDYRQILSHYYQNTTLTQFEQSML